MVKVDEPVPEVIRRGRALLGFMEREDAIDFLQGMCVWDSLKDREELETLWRHAHDAADELTRSYTRPAVADLPEAASKHLRNVEKAALFKQVFAGHDVEFKGVEVGPIVAFQKFVDVDYCEQLGATDRALESQEALETCIPVEFPVQTMVNVDRSNRAITFISRELNPTIVGFGLGQTDGGQPMAQFLLGSNANYVQAVEYRGRVILKNGYHRAYSMQRAGASHIPCLLVHAKELIETGVAREGFFGERLLFSDRPPLMRDFLDESLSADIRLRGVKKIIRITVDEAVLPV